MKFYFYHPESDYIWEEEHDDEDFVPVTDGLVENITKERYE